MNKTEILIRKSNKLLIPNVDSKESKPYDTRPMTLQAELMKVGYMMDQDLCEQLSCLDDIRFEKIYRQAINTCKKLVGDDVKYTPMYPNFPKQVMEMDLADLYYNAILHYISFGQWLPQFQADPRTPAYESIKYRMLSAGKYEDIVDIARGILASNSSVTDTDKEIVEWCLNNFVDAYLKDNIIPETIPFKENLCWFAARCFELRKGSVGIESLKTATDILRFVTSLSGGDITLAQNTKFKSLRRKLRRQLAARLDVVANDDDMFRHRGKWIRLAHSLHAAEYPYTRLRGILSRLRSRNYRYVSFEGRVDAAMSKGDYANLIKLLETRPGIFARRLDHILRIFYSNSRNIIERFLAVADKVDTRVLVQLYGHFNGRAQASTRLVFPKGSTSKAILLDNPLPTFASSVIDRLMEGIQQVLEDRFAQRESLGAVYIDPALSGCPIPLSLRSASEGLKVVARGTRFPMEDKNTIRMFIYWVGRDIDLTASLLDSNFQNIADLSYYNLRQGNIGAHSGDITYAPTGASEFIDVNIDEALKKKARYVCMQVNVYSGPTFAEHSVCYAGWMMRDKPQSNEIYDPKTVSQRVNVMSKSKTAIPALFDLETREIIWLDVATPNTRYAHGGNNALSNRAQVTDIIRGAVDMQNKPNLYDLFVMHANVRAEEYVDNIEDADTVFSIEEGITPSDTTTILSEYL